MCTMHRVPLWSSALLSMPARRGPRHADVQLDRGRGRVRGRQAPWGAAQHEWQRPVRLHPAAGRLHCFEGRLTSARPRRLKSMASSQRLSVDMEATRSMTCTTGNQYEEAGSCR